MGKNGMRIITAANFRQDIKTILDLCSTGETIYITRGDEVFSLIIRKDLSYIYKPKRENDNET